MIPVAALEAVIGPLAPGVPEPAGNAPRLSPGQVERHYAPRAALELLSREQLESAARSGIAGSVGVLVYSDVRLPQGTISVRLPDDADGYARGLYAALHQLDHAGCERILVELPPDTPEWHAVHDRLRRAAH
jgi:L-threonylcarbamoyladenylate synthase